MTTSPIPVAPHSVRVPADRRPFPFGGLSILSLGVFLAITSEVTPTGLMPEMSADLGVSQAQIGLLVSYFAFTVVLTSAPLTAVTARLPRKQLLIGVLVLLGVANLATGIAPSHALIVVARIIGGLAHGMFWSMTPAYSAHLVSREQLGRAVALTQSGGTLALVLGVPLATALGHAVGWRWAFATIGGALVLGAIAVALWLPAVTRDPLRETDAGTTGRDSSVIPVAIVCVTVAIVMIGNYAFYTYIAPYLIGPIGVPAELVSLALFAYGAAGAIGLVLTGTVFARRTRLGLVLALASSALAVAALVAVTGAGAPASVSLLPFALWGLAFGMVPPLLQTRLLQVASERIRDTASAFYTTAFNTGISGGAFVGALLLPSFGIGALPVVNAALTLIGLAIVLVVVAGSRRERAM